ncbi:CAP-associated domain-containing protein [Bacillus benzoevorans]
MSLLKTFIRIMISLVTVAAIGFWINVSDKENQGVPDNQDYTVSDENQDENIQPSSAIHFKTEGLFRLIGSTKKEVRKQLGEPSRVDLSAYGYDWWIYNKNQDEYLQVGMDKGKAVTVYALGKDVDISPFYIGQSIGDIYAMNIIDTNISFEYKDSSYHFELSEEEINTNPLIHIENVFVQLYIDKFTGELSSIRLMNAPTLIKIRPYELLFRGDLLEPPNDIEIDEKKLERDLEMQVHEMANIFRIRHKAEPLQLDEKIAEAAYSHSVDMFESNNFSSTSEEYGEVSERLRAGGVNFQSFGENIAYDYIDAADVLEGWLNDKEYRDHLLNADFTHFGAGVYKNYYTMDMIQRQ